MNQQAKRYKFMWYHIYTSTGLQPLLCCGDIRDTPVAVRHLIKFKGWNMSCAWTVCSSQGFGLWELVQYGKD